MTGSQIAEVSMCNHLSF